MNRPCSPYRDAQQMPCTARCAYCGGDLYDRDEFYAINGLVICEGCLGAFARDNYRSFRLTGEEWRTL